MAFEDNSLLGPPFGHYLLSYRNPFGVKGPSSPTYSFVTPLTAFEPKAKPQLREAPRSYGASRKNVISLSPQRLPLLASCKRQPPPAPVTQAPSLAPSPVPRPAAASQGPKAGPLLASPPLASPRPLSPEQPPGPARRLTAPLHRTMKKVLIHEEHTP